MSPYGMMLPTLSEVIHLIVVVYIYTVLPVLFIISLLFKLILRKFVKFFKTKPHLLNLVSSVFIPISALILLITIDAGETSSPFQLSIVLCIISASLFILHEISFALMRLKMKRRLLTLLLILLLAIVLYPREVKETARVSGESTEIITNCGCLGIRMGSDYERVHYCYGLVTTCKQTTNKFPPDLNMPL